MTEGRRELSSGDEAGNGYRKRKNGLQSVAETKTIPIYSQQEKQLRMTF
jgi:hypothetical protein